MRTIALAGNPNTGKSTLFNALTGLKQHTGNWSGKTVLRAEGRLNYKGVDYTIIDLPGTYSLMANSEDERIARDFILLGQPDVTVVVLDATSLERNLNLALQVMEVTSKVILCLNLMDEALRKGIRIDIKGLSNELGVPVIPITARKQQGLEELKEMMEAVITGRIQTNPKIMRYSEEIEQAVEKLLPELSPLLPKQISPRWVALQLLSGDQELIQTLIQFSEDKTAFQSFGLNRGEEKLSCHF